jgi:hypothetical protein
MRPSLQSNHRLQQIGDKRLKPVAARRATRSSLQYSHCGAQDFAFAAAVDCARRIRGAPPDTASSSLGCVGSRRAVLWLGWLGRRCRPGACPAARVFGAHADRPRKNSSSDRAPGGRVGEGEHTRDIDEPWDTPLRRLMATSECQVNPRMAQYAHLLMAHADHRWRAKVGPRQRRNGLTP